MEFAATALVQHLALARLSLPVPRTADWPSLFVVRMDLPRRRVQFGKAKLPFRVHDFLSSQSAMISCVASMLMPAPQ